MLAGPPPAAKTAAGYLRQEENDAIRNAVMEDKVRLGDSEPEQIYKLPISSARLRWQPFPATSQVLPLAGRKLHVYWA